MQTLGNTWIHCDALDWNLRIHPSAGIKTRSYLTKDIDDMMMNGERPFAILNIQEDAENEAKVSANASAETLVMNVFHSDSPSKDAEEQVETTAMGLSRPTRLLVLSSFTFTYFLVELVVGYAAGSIALVADSFHMVCVIS